MWEYEFFEDYHEMSCVMEQFAVELLKLTHPEELNTLLVQGPSGKYLETLQYSVDLERKNVSFVTSFGSFFWSDELFFGFCQYMRLV